MDYVDIINYCQEYEREVVNLWNDTLTADPISIYKFRKQVLFDDNFIEELCTLALENGEVVGFLLSTKRKFPYLERGLEPTRGWINVLFVKKQYCRNGIGTMLVKDAEKKLQDMGAETVTLGAYSPNYFFPGIDKDNYSDAIRFFDKLGYEAGKESYSMCKELHGYQISVETKSQIEKASQEGFSFMNFDYKYALKLLEFARVEFGGGWKRNALISMQNNTAEDCIILALDKNDEIVGFCMRMIDGNPMRFGPIGVKETVRNYGIGGILLDIMQFEMKKKGIYQMYFVSTEKNGRRFYERHGVYVFRTFIDYQKSF